MTSANFYSGYVIDKPTSKVINPPGGRSNNIFGATEEPPKTQAQQRQENNQTRNASTVFGESTSILQSRKRTGYNPITGTAYDDEVHKPIEQKTEPTPQATENTPTETVQVETKPAEIAAKQQETSTAYQPRNIHTSSKVSQPPGGASTKLW